MAHEIDGIKLKIEVWYWASLKVKRKKGNIKLVITVIDNLLTHKANIITTSMQILIQWYVLKSVYLVEKYTLSGFISNVTK